MTIPYLRPLVLTPLIVSLSGLVTAAHADPSAEVYRKAYICLSSNRCTEATALFKTAASSTNAALAAASRFGLAEAYYRLKRWDDAIAAYDAVLKRDAQSPYAPQALYARGLAECQAGYLERGRDSLAAFAARYPKHKLAKTAADSAMTLTRTLEAQAEQKKTEAIARELQTINTLASQRKFAETANAATRFLTVHPNDPQAPDLLYLAASSARHAGDATAAAAAYSLFLERYPHHAQAERARLEQAHALRDLERYAEAADAYAASTDPQAASLRAECLFKAERYQDALTLFESLAQQAKTPAEKAQATLTVGDCHAALRQWDPAERAFLNVEVLGGADSLRPVALERLANLYARMGRTNEAARVQAERARRYPSK